MSDLHIHKLRCEYLENPLGIDETVPRLSWQLESARRGAKQRSYRVIVASDLSKCLKNTPDLWDSGVVKSHQSTHIEYAGKPLTSRQRCYWRVQVIDETGECTLSETAFWSMGLLSQNDWSASWVTADPEIIRRDPQAIAPTLEEPGTPALFRREFDVPKPLARATVYVSARGLFELRLNGQRIGEDIFAPEWTDYDKRIHYRSYDVTHLLNHHANCIAATLGDGWWSGYVGWQEQRGRYGSLENSLLLQLEIEHSDGSITKINSDENWRCETGPILSSDFMMGEVYDARRYKTAWDQANYNDSTWLLAREVSAPKAKLVAQRSEAIRIIETLKPQSVAEITTGVFIYDIGQNISGWLRLTLPVLPAGIRITLRHGERLNEDGRLHTSNLRRALSTDRYITRGGAPETWQPHFTFHGFQYVELSISDHTELTANPFAASLNTLSACVIHSATSRAGHFECSHEGVNRLWLNTLWSQKDNFISVPTDCPQRDERLGWTGDAQVFLRTASCNMDVAAFFTKWMIDIEDGQTVEGIFPDTAPRLREDINFVGLNNLGGAAGWADAGIIIPYTVWRIYGDQRILQRHYKSMVRWLDWIEEHNPSCLREHKLANNYGDWLCIPSDTSFGTQSPMKTLLATAFWADDCNKLRRIAEALGYQNDASRFHKMFIKVRDAFQKNWLLPEGKLKVETQTAYLLALAFDLLPTAVRTHSANHLVNNIRECDWHLSTGFIGVGLLNPQLTLAGHADVAYRLLTQESYPAWLYPIKHGGATTIWERWNAWTDKDGFFDPHMNSFNHYSLGSVGEWLFRHVAGIELDTDEPGSQHFVLCPYIDKGTETNADSLRYANAKLNTLHGVIKSHWQKEHTHLRWEICIPANTTADVGVPTHNADKVLLDDMALRNNQYTNSHRIEHDRCWLTLPSGEYQFIIKN